MQEIWDSFARYQFLENDFQHILYWVCTLFAGVLLKRFISRYLSRILYQICSRFSKEVPVSEFVDLLQKPLEFLLLLLFGLLAFSFLHFPASWHLVEANNFGVKKILKYAYGTVLMIAFAWASLRLIDYVALVLKARFKENSETQSELQMVHFGKQLLKIMVATLYFFATLGIIYGLNVGAIVAGLGIGGLAFALAGKETLENLLASGTIFLDKPFAAGDWVKIGSVEGHVEKIGFRSTQIRSLDKSLITMPNKKMIDEPLENMSARTQKRAKFQIGLPYSATSEQIERITQSIFEALESHSLIAPKPIVVLEEFGEYAIHILVVFFVESPQMEVYLQVKQEINYRIIHILDAYNLEFEFPTTNVILKSGEK